MKLGLDPISSFEEDGEVLGQSIFEGEVEGETVKT